MNTFGPVTLGVTSDVRVASVAHEYEAPGLLRAPSTSKFAATSENAVSTLTSTTIFLPPRSSVIATLARLLVAAERTSPNTILLLPL